MHLKCTFQTKKFAILWLLSGGQKRLKGTLYIRLKCTVSEGTGGDVRTTRRCGRAKAREPGLSKRALIFLTNIREKPN